MEPLENDIVYDSSSFLKKIITIIKVFYPIKMLLRAYSIIILMVDILWILMCSVMAVLQAGVELLRPPPRKSLRDELALVVGSSRGVGEEIALELAKLGAKVICVDKNKERNDLAVLGVKRRSKSHKVWSYTCDVTNKNKVAQMGMWLKKEMGYVSMIFHCCGIPSARTLLHAPPVDVHETMDISLTSHFWLLDTFLPDMKKLNHGHIVALTSVAGLSQIRSQLPLSVSQFAVQGLAESLQEDIRLSRKHGVHVTLVHIYPFIIGGNDVTDIRLRIPSYFGTMHPSVAARAIIESVRRNYVEVSIPGHLIFLGHCLRILPRKATILIRELLDTGVDFG